MFKDETGSCAGWSESSEFPGREVCAAVFPTIFVLYLNDLHPQALLSTKSISPL